MLKSKSRQNQNDKARTKVAILGSGNIGTDLLIKIMRSQYLRCSFFIGRKLGSGGMARAINLGVRISDHSVEAIVDEPDCCDIVFDCTSSETHKRHWTILEKLGKRVIDLTPAKVGRLCIPSVNMEECLTEPNINMVSCGGQTAIPLAYVLGQTQQHVEYIEVVSTIASLSAGPATRLDIDEYIHTTELGLKTFSGCQQTKAILNLNPAEPPIDMQTTVFAKVGSPDMERLHFAVTNMVEKIRKYVPGYQIIVPPTDGNNRISIMVKVRGIGDYLQKYAGNLDIINCAAVYAAEEFAKDGLRSRVRGTASDKCDESS